MSELVKVQPRKPVPVGTKHFDKTHKAAIILASLTPETASSIVNEISDAQLRIFAQAFSDLQSISPQTLHEIAAEFVEEVNSICDNLQGGTEETRRVLGQLAEGDRIDRVFGETDESSSEPGTVWEKLEALPAETLAEYLQEKKTPVAAAIISRLGVEKTACVLEVCESDFSKKVLFILSSKGPPSDEVVDEIGVVVEEELLTSSGTDPKPVGLGLLVGEIINFLPPTKRDAFLDYLNEEDPDIGSEVRKAILTFEELHARLPANAITVLTRDVDSEILMQALKFGEKTAPETVEFILSNISKRMAAQYREDIAEMAEIDESDGEKAHREFTGVVKRLAAEGEFVINPLPEADEGSD